MNSIVAVCSIGTLEKSISAPKPRRATVVTFVGSGISLGAIGSGIAAAQLIAPYGWRAVFVVGGVLPLLLAAARRQDHQRPDERDEDRHLADPSVPDRRVGVVAIQGHAGLLADPAGHRQEPVVDQQRAEVAAAHHERERRRDEDDAGGLEEGRHGRRPAAYLRAPGGRPVRTGCHLGVTRVGENGDIRYPRGRPLCANT